jgi:iron complex transport system permease protein
MKTRLLILISVVAGILAFALLVGPRPINPFAMSGLEREILFSVRLPRLFVAMLMGGALGAAGAVLQGVLRNPLADPYILGLSSGAALGAAAGIVLGLTFFGALTVPLMAFAGAIVTGLLVGLMGWRRGGLWPERLLLAGIGVGFMFSAVLMLVMSVSSNEGLRRAILWIFGDLAMSDWSLIPYGALLIVIGLAIALRHAKALNALMLGDDLSHSLGFSPRKETALLFVSAGLLTAASVTLGGMVGFIGLLMPHIMRFFVGTDNRLLIPASVLGGGALLVVADLIGRTVMIPNELPAGMITALLGAPYFLYLLRRRDVIG